jgi:hypothetical protein
MLSGFESVDILGVQDEWRRRDVKGSVSVSLIVTFDKLNVLYCGSNMITITRDGMLEVSLLSRRAAPLAWPLCGVASPYFKLIHVTVPRLILTTSFSPQGFLREFFFSSITGKKKVTLSW